MTFVKRETKISVILCTSNMYINMLIHIFSSIYTTDLNSIEDIHKDMSSLTSFIVI